MRSRLLVLALTVAACAPLQAPASTATAEPSPTLSAAAKSYLDTAIDWIAANALYASNVPDWAVLRQRAYRVADGATDTAGTHDAIRYVLYQLGDHHSHFTDPAQTASVLRGEANLHPPTARKIGNRVGYIDLPSFTGDNPLAVEYASTAQREIARVDDAMICGWIVDLRTNTGGDMWPMIAGVGPILGDDPKIGAFDWPSHRQQWGYEAGSSSIDGYRVVTVAAPYTLHRVAPPVAVLTSGQTASSGEAVVVAFRGRPATRSFGEATAGVPTANIGKDLSDGAVIVLTVAFMADRTGQAYDNRIAPDQVLAPPVDEIAVAATWLNQQPACRS